MMSQSLSKNLIHIVFSTKDRKSLLSDEIRSNLYPYLSQILMELDCIAYEINGTDNHVHILCEVSRSHSISEIIRNLKTGSTNWLKKTKNRENFCWQHGYGIFSVSFSVKAAVANYIKNQTQHHKKFSFEEELKLILEKHEIKYDEKYLWN
jgi:putative transposase